MTTATVLLASVADPSGRPAALLPATAGGAGRVVERLATVAARHGPVTVLARPAGVEPLREALASVDGPGDVEVVAIEGAAATWRWLAQQRPPDGAAVVVGYAHLAADEVALTSLLDDAAGGTAVLAEPAGAPAPEETVGHVAGCPALRSVRGRLVAASSDVHTVTGATERAVGLLRIGAGDVAAAQVHARTLADAVEAGAIPDDADPLAGSLVALIRDGHPVRPVLVPRRGYARLVTTSSQAIEAGRRLDGLDLDRVRLDASVKREDGFFTTFLVSSYSPYLARTAARVGLTPDAVTVLSMALGVGAAAGFAHGSFAGLLLGAVLLQVAFTLDCVDGQLARYTRRFSTRGAWLDSVFDRGKEYVVLAGLAAGGVAAGETAPLWLLAGVALALQTVRHTLDLGYEAQQTTDVERTVRRPLLAPADGGPGFWEAVPDAGAASADAPTRTADAVGPDHGGSSTGARGLARRVIVALRRAEGVPVLKWAKRIVVLPIGERFALISIVAVVAGPTAVFVALLVWGGLATAYTFTGRLVRSLA